MKTQLIKKLNIAAMTILVLFAGCKKEETIGATVNSVYITSNAVTGTGPTASTTITNTASGKVSVSPAVARVYVNTLKDTDVTVAYTIDGTALAGVNYTPPGALTITIPAGKWYADIEIPVINTPLTANRTIRITMNTASNDTQVGIGTDRNYRTFTYTLTN